MLKQHRTDYLQSFHLKWCASFFVFCFLNTWRPVIWVDCSQNVRTLTVAVGGKGEQHTKETAAHRNTWEFQKDKKYTGKPRGRGLQSSVTDWLSRMLQTLCSISSTQNLKIDLATACTRQALHNPNVTPDWGGPTPWALESHTATWTR